MSRSGTILDRLHAALAEAEKVDQVRVAALELEFKELMTLSESEELSLGSQGSIRVAAGRAQIYLGYAKYPECREDAQLLRRRIREESDDD